MSTMTVLEPPGYEKAASAVSGLRSAGHERDRFFFTGAKESRSLFRCSISTCELVTMELARGGGTGL